MFSALSEGRCVFRKVKKGSVINLNVKEFFFEMLDLGTNFCDLVETREQLSQLLRILVKNHLSMIEREKHF